MIVLSNDLSIKLGEEDHLVLCRGEEEVSICKNTDAETIAFFIQHCEKYSREIIKRINDCEGVMNESPVWRAIGEVSGDVLSTDDAGKFVLKTSYYGASEQLITELDSTDLAIVRTIFFDYFNKNTRFVDFM